MLTDQERADFREAAHAALATREVIEYLGHNHLAGRPLRQETIDRVLETIKPTAKVLWAIYQRTGILPRLRFRGFLFCLSIAPGNIIDVQFFRESDVVSVE